MEPSGSAIHLNSSTILLGVVGLMYASNTLHHLKELGLDSQRAHKTALNCMLTLCIMRTNCQPPSRSPSFFLWWGGRHLGPMCLLFLD